MQKRTIEEVPNNYSALKDKPGYSFETIGANYYPVDSAIIMRDENQ